MKYYFKLTFLGIIVLSSCGDSSKTQIDGTQQINVSLVFEKNISDNPSDPMPSAVKSFIQPIEGGKLPFVPKVTFFRLDLNKDSVSVFEIPTETANGLRKKFGTYDYNNLKDDLSANLPTLQIGSYLSHLSSSKSSYNFSTTSDDISYTLRIGKDSSNQDSIIKDIKNTLIAKNELPKRFVIFYDTPKVVMEKQTTLADTTTTSKTSSVTITKQTAQKALTKKKKEHAPTGSLEEYFLELANPNITYESKSGIREKILQFFTSPNAEVIFVNSSQETSTGIAINKYVKTISMTNRKVNIVDKKIEDGKIFEIYVSEK
jgi:hypothetical protein